jgi:colicin import membrane protein
MRSPPNHRNRFNRLSAVGGRYRGSEFYYRRGLLCSFLGHLGLLVGMGINILFHDDHQPVVYSVSFEGGSTVGGISQVAQDDKKQPVAPPKKVQVQEQKVEDAEIQKDPVKKPEELKKDDAELSLAKQTPTPKATPTPKPQATPKPTASAASTPKPQPSKAPTPKSTPKPVASRPPTLDEINKRLQQAVQRYTGESTDAGGKTFGSAGTGGSGLGGGKVMPPAFFIYKKLIENQIKGGWRWHDQTQSILAKVCFRISEKGDLSDVRLCQASGNREYDESIFRAVVKANPLPPPPPEVYQYFREVNMTFTPVD